MARTRKAETPKEHVKTWKDVSGKMTVWGNIPEGRDFITYSTTVSSKDVDGKYVNCYMGVRFKKDDDPDAEGRVDIDVKSGFITCGRGSDGNNRMYVFVTDYDIDKIYNE